MAQEEIIKLLEKEGKIKVLILNKPLSKTEIAIRTKMSDTIVSHSLNKLLKHNEVKCFELDRFEALLEVYFTSLEDMDHQFKSDLYFDEDDDEDLMQFMAPAYRELIMCTHGSEWWNRTAKARCTPSFYDKIQKIRNGWASEND